MNLLPMWLVIAHKSLKICTSGTSFFRKSILQDTLYNVCPLEGLIFSTSLQVYAKCEGEMECISFLAASSQWAETNF